MHQILSITSEFDTVIFIQEPFAHNSRGSGKRLRFDSILKMRFRRDDEVKELFEEYVHTYLDLTFLPCQIKSNQSKTLLPAGG